MSLGLGEVAGFFAGTEYEVRDLRRQYADGIAIDLDPIHRRLDADIQPATPRDIERLTEGDRRRRSWRVYTEGTLFVPERGSRAESEIKILGRWCRVRDVPEEWQDWRVYVVTEVGA